MKPAVVLALGVAFLVLLALLPSAEAAPQLAGMSTLTKPKKPARRAAARPQSIKQKIPSFMAISPVTGLPVKPLAAGQKTVSREALNAALALAL